jgi:hypothetical protein
MLGGILFVVLCFCACVVQGRFGVDLSVATDVDTWTCLINQNIEYAKVRAYRSSGKLDTNAAPSLLNANKAGMKDLDAYIFPCISTSPYSIANNITCTSATEQLTQTVNYLADNGIYFRKRKDGVFLNRMWLDIEDENPSKYYDPDTSVNLAYMQEVTEAAKKLHIPMGIYTTKTYWSQIMNNTEAYSGTDRLGRYEYPLWYPRYDGVNTMDFFAPFGGWESVLIKQTGGDVGYCGVSQVDSDYMEDNDYAF